jgi:thymidylate kinase
MFTVALIGEDGAGKTTIAKKLLESYPLPMKYLYMGIHVPSSNVALPTSRLAYLLKLHSYRRSLKHARPPQPQSPAVHRAEYRPVKRGPLGTAARLLNRLAEEWFRQLVSWMYQLRGYIVIYDRHFLFEYGFATHNFDKHNKPLTERLHYYSLTRLYPKPDLVILLDAPPSVLLERKQEWPLEVMEKRQEKYLELAEQVPNFARVDATQPLHTLLADVARQIEQFYVSRYAEKSNGNDRKT